MTGSQLALPLDVPWRRIAISEDMYARDLHGRLPVRWRSSIAVFAYDPEPDPDLSNPEERTTFLKVAATVTGYQADPAEIGSPRVPAAYATDVRRSVGALGEVYYPALAALLQVAVVPAAGNWSLDQYPYLTDFEPKKRELVEVVTDTGEALTASASQLNVRKGTTTTDSTEVDNIDRGWSFGVAAQYAGAGASVSASHQGEWGTRDRAGTDSLNLVTTDASREKRETFSHATTLSQLYHQLDSYHAGTNRALFFLNARPHVIQGEQTLVRGPRELEGVQEFFLVVRRPIDMEEICVTAVLETAHLHRRPADPPPPAPAGAVAAASRSLRQAFALPNPDGSRTGHWTMPLPGGYQVDRSRGGGTWTTRTSDGHVLRTELPPGLSIVRLEFATTSDAALSLPVFTVYDDHVDLEAAVYSSILGGGTWQLVLDVFLRPIDAPDAPLPAPAPEAVDLFLTARAVRSCADPALPTSPWISYEQELAADVIANWRRAGVGTGKDAALAANAVSRSVREGVIESHRSEARYAPGEVGFFQTDFALAALAPSLPRAVSRWLDVPLPEAPQLGDEARALVKERGSSMTVREALAIPPPTLAALLEVDTERARGLVNALLGFGADAESSEAAKAPVVRVHASPQSGGRKGGDKPKA